MNPATTLLKIDASGRRDGSLSRSLGTRLVDGLVGAGIVDSVTERDLLGGIELVDPAWIGANFTSPDDRDDDARARLAGSDALVDELVAADILVIGCPIYNFGPPAALKAWIDQIARARRTFAYTDRGPEGLLKGKRAYVIVTSGGTEVDSPTDFATPYLRHVLGFVGIHDVTVIEADRTMMRDDAAQAAAERIDALVAAAREDASGASTDAVIAAAGSPRGQSDPAFATKVSH